MVPVVGAAVVVVEDEPDALRVERLAELGEQVAPRRAAGRDGVHRRARRGQVEAPPRRGEDDVLGAGPLRLRDVARHVERVHRLLEGVAPPLLVRGGERPVRADAERAGEPVRRRARVAVRDVGGAQLRRLALEELPAVDEALHRARVDERHRVDGFQVPARREVDRSAQPAAFRERPGAAGPARRGDGAEVRTGRERKPRQPLAPVERLRPDPFDAGRNHEVAGQVPADPERGVAELLEPRRQRERVRGADAPGERARPERADGRRDREGLEASVARMDEPRPDRGGREARVAFDVRKRVERPVALRRRRANLPQDDPAGMGGVLFVDDRHPVARERLVAVAVDARHPGGPDGNRGGSRQDGRRKQEGMVVVHAGRVWRFCLRKASAEDARIARRGGVRTPPRRGFSRGREEKC